ncbi:hypothetical protein FRC01_011323 [Tulasnella sp. 417]|nr:hypothetical protein FRC01_011323 [Tulasnella sp. 417]
MASGVADLEALLATSHSSFLSASSTAGSQEDSHQHIAAARGTLTPPSILPTGPCPCGARIEALQLSKQINDVKTEVRQGTSQIRELVQTM